MFNSNCESALTAQFGALELCTKHIFLPQRDYKVFHQTKLRSEKITQFHGNKSEKKFQKEKLLEGKSAALSFVVADMKGAS